MHMTKPILQTCFLARSYFALGNENQCILAGLPTFKQLLSRVKGVVLGALANSELPFSQVLQALSEDQDTLDETCVFQTAFNVELSDAPASDAVQRIPVSL